MEFLSEILSFVIGAFAGSLFTIYFKNLKASGRGNAVDQSNSKAQGDIVGRDKTGQ